MSKAEERALEKYPYKEGYNVELPYPSTYDENKEQREAFIKGYHQAENDLEMTWEDLELLQDISREVFAEVGNGDVDYYQIYPTRQSFFEEVLKRYKAQKEK